MIHNHYNYNLFIREPSWQHIESAPKDGSFIRLWDKIERTGTWSAEQQRWKDSIGTCSPTHWMPIPPPPKDTK